MVRTGSGYASERIKSTSSPDVPAAAISSRSFAVIAAAVGRRSAIRFGVNTCATRLRNRDSVDGRPRGYYRTFGLSRVRLREMAHRDELPGITKSSW